MFYYESPKIPYENPGDSVVRVRVVVGVNAGVILALGLALLVPLVRSLLYPDGSWKSFLILVAVVLPLGVAGLRASQLHGVRYVLDRDVYLSIPWPGCSRRCSAGSRTCLKAPSKTSSTLPSSL